MSQANLDALSDGFDALNSADLGRILAFIDADFAAVTPAAFSAEPDTYRGHDGVRRYLRSFGDDMEDIRFHPDRFWDAEDAVVVDVRLTAKGKRTAIPVEQRFTQVWTMREGKAVRVRAYASPADALEAVGLTE